MVDHRANVDHAVSVIEAAVRDTDGVLDHPAAEVELAGVLGRFADVRIHVWHGPTVDEQRAAVHGATRALLAACVSEGIELDGPAVVTFPASLPGDEAVQPGTETG